MNTTATHFALSLLLVLLSSSCTKHADLPDNDLPDGKYPMTFASSVEEMPLAQAQANDTWTEGDVVAMKVGEEVKQYTAEANGTLSAGDPFYWKNSKETKTVTAWYCGDGSTAANGGNAGQVPASWTVKADQANNDGYKESDFLYASKSISFKDRESTSLPFYHQTARVVINIKNAEAATVATDIASVVIGDANNNNLALSGTYSPPGAGINVGKWSLVGSIINGTITPKDITAGTTYLKSYAALVIPQDMKDKKFIAITLKGGITYYYTPTGSNATLESGKEYTYNVTVKFGYLDVVKVEDTGGDWGSDGTKDVNSEPITP